MRSELGGNTTDTKTFKTFTEFVQTIVVVPALTIQWAKLQSEMWESGERY